MILPAYKSSIKNISTDVTVACDKTNPAFEQLWIGELILIYKVDFRKECLLMGAVMKGVRAFW